MYPNTFLRSLWRLEVKPQVFIAMSFDEQYNSRFERVIAPAVTQNSYRGVTLLAHRVDLSRTGDSILTEINEAVAHSLLVVADVSVVGRDSVSGSFYRNSNVLYEVGVALACRQPHEVLLVRDDNDRCLFDVSTVPHLTINFAEEDAAREILADSIQDRLKECDYLGDARVEMALASLGPMERSALMRFDVVDGVGTYDTQSDEVYYVDDLVGFPRLLDKQVIVSSLSIDSSSMLYRLTELGLALYERCK